MELGQAITKRRSIRQYLPQAVEPEKLLELIAAAQKAPVSCNLQLIHYIIIDEKAKLAELKQRVSAKFAYAPAAILAVNDPRFTVERDSVVTALGMAIENMLLRAVELELATCPMAGFKHDEVIKEILGIPKELKIGLLISVGYPDPEVYHSVISKQPLDQTYSWNHFNASSLLNASLRLSDQTPASLRDYRSRIGSVYLDRFRLNTWSDQLYHKAAAFFKEQLPTLLPSGTILDLMSYDAKFLQLIKPDMQVDQIITATDYVPEHLEVYRALLGCQVALIDGENKLPTISEQFDLVTCVFQSVFTPNFSQLLASGVSLLRPGGFLVIIHGQESFQKRLVRYWRQFMRRATGKLVNIYEGNPYYRIGPYAHVSAQSIIKNIENEGLQITKKIPWTQQGINCTIIIAQLPLSEASSRPRSN